VAQIADSNQKLLQDNARMDQACREQAKQLKSLQRQIQHKEGMVDRLQKDLAIAEDLADEQRSLAARLSQECNPSLKHWLLERSRIQLARLEGLEWKNDALEYAIEEVEGNLREEAHDAISAMEYERTIAIASADRGRSDNPPQTKGIQHSAPALPHLVSTPDRPTTSNPRRPLVPTIYQSARDW
ncbi:hypothetical protein QFC20_000284, partial [Naganishia adeliensis]